MNRLEVRVYYDFASTLCFVAHRVLERMQPTLDELELALRWSPVDLTDIAGHRRGGEMPAERRDHVHQVAESLGVSVRVPRVWLDSRVLGAAALLAERAGREPSFRERAFTRLYEEERPVEDAVGVAGLARDLELALDPAQILDQQPVLEARTRQAREEQVTGVPTFMLGAWPFGGIQTEETMQRVFERFARKARQAPAL